MPFDTCLNYEVPPSDGEKIWQSLIEVRAFVTNRDGSTFNFAAEQLEATLSSEALAEPGPTLKVEADYLWTRPDIRGDLVDIVVTHPCVQEADLLSYAPNGPRQFTHDLGRHDSVGKSVINLWRPRDAPRWDIRYGDENDDGESDRELTRAVGSICLIEDVSSTGSTAHRSAEVLRQLNPGLVIHSLSLLQRGDVKSRYQEGPSAVMYHTILQRRIPRKVETFKALFSGISVREV
jgi:hypothetical protein